MAVIRELVPDKRCRDSIRKHWVSSGETESTTRIDLKRRTDADRRVAESDTITALLVVIVVDHQPFGVRLTPFWFDVVPFLVPGPVSSPAVLSFPDICDVLRESSPPAASFAHCLMEWCRVRMSS